MSGAARSSLWKQGVKAWLQRPTLERWNVPAAVVAWSAFTVAICVAVGLDPKGHTVTPEYFHAARAWMESGALYRPGPHGYLYLPQAAILAVPFAAMPEPWGDVAWRIVMLGALLWGLWRLAGATERETSGRARAFGLMTIMVIAATAAAARNGQTNLLLSALFVHAAVELSKSVETGRRWKDAAFWRASALLWIGFAWKPIVLVPLMLMAGVFPWSIPALAVGGAVVAGLPFMAHANWTYVSGQYAAGIDKVMEAGTSDKAGRFCELGGMFDWMGMTIPPAVLTGMRLLAAIATFGFAWLGRARLGRETGAVLLLAWSATYLMLFNPRTETNSYVILGPWVAMVSVWCSSRVRMPVLGWVLATGALLLGVADEVLQLKPDYVARPVVAMGFSIVLGWWAMRQGRPAERLAGQQSQPVS